MQALLEVAEGGGGDDDDGDGACSLNARVGEAVRIEVTSLRQRGGLGVFQRVADDRILAGHKAAAEGAVIYNDSLDLWRQEARDFPCLAKAACRVLAILATQVQFEHMF